MYYLPTTNSKIKILYTNKCGTYSQSRKLATKKPKYFLPAAAI